MIPSKKKLAITFLPILLCGLFSMTGCKDTAKENTLAEAAETKKELLTVKADLAKITSERDNLKKELAAVKEIQDKLPAATDQVATVQKQLSELTKERDTALAKATDAQALVEKLKSQLQEQIQKVTGLEGQNKTLQEMIDQLKKQLGGSVKIPELPKS
ncbi:MAG: hypothetical protein JXA82_17650 [Sedimentisphaerales bacterium]|nr:hypothetical protein [Sedimentisphaerales bacterium]